MNSFDELLWNGKPGPHVASQAYWLQTQSYILTTQALCQTQDAIYTSQVSNLSEMKYFPIQTLKITFRTLSNWILQMFLWMQILNVAFVIDRSTAFVKTPKQASKSRMASNHCIMACGKGSDY